MITTDQEETIIKKVRIDELKNAIKSKIKYPVIRMYLSMNPHFSLKTQKQYMYILQKFVKDFPSLQGSNPSFNASLNEMAQYFEKLEKETLQGFSRKHRLPSTIAHHALVIKSFLHFLRVNEFWTVKESTYLAFREYLDKWSRIPSPRLGRKNAISLETYQKLLSKIFEPNQRYLVKFLWITGSRLQEALFSEVKHIIAEMIPPRVKILGVKGRSDYLKPRYFPLLDKKTLSNVLKDQQIVEGLSHLYEREILTDWIKIRDELYSPNGNHLFCDRKGSPLKNSTVHYWFKKWSEKIGKKITSHQFRYAVIQKLRQDQVPLHAEYRVMGHSFKDAHQLYLTKTWQQTCEEVILARVEALKRRIMNQDSPDKSFLHHILV